MADIKRRDDDLCEPTSSSGSGWMRKLFSIAAYSLGYVAFGAACVWLDESQTSLADCRDAATQQNKHCLMKLEHVTASASEQARTCQAELAASRGAIETFQDHCQARERAQNEEWQRTMGSVAAMASEQAGALLEELRQEQNQKAAMESELNMLRETQAELQNYLTALQDQHQLDHVSWDEERKHLDVQATLTTILQTTQQELQDTVTELRAQHQRDHDAWEEERKYLQVQATLSKDRMAHDKEQCQKELENVTELATALQATQQELQTNVTELMEQRDRDRGSWEEERQNLELQATATKERIAQDNRKCHMDLENFTVLATILQNNVTDLRAQHQRELGSWEEERKQLEFTVTIAKERIAQDNEQCQMKLDQVTMLAMEQVRTCQAEIAAKQVEIATSQEHYQARERAQNEEWRELQTVQQMLQMTRQKLQTAQDEILQLNRLVESYKQGPNINVASSKWNAIDRFLGNVDYIAMLMIPQVLGLGSAGDVALTLPHMFRQVKHKRLALLPVLLLPVGIIVLALGVFFARSGGSKRTRGTDPAVDSGMMEKKAQASTSVNSDSELLSRTDPKKDFGSIAPMEPVQRSKVKKQVQFKADDWTMPRESRTPASNQARAALDTTTTRGSTEMRVQKSASTDLDPMELLHRIKPKRHAQHKAETGATHRSTSLEASTEVSIQESAEMKSSKNHRVNPTLHTPSSTPTSNCVNSTSVDASVSNLAGISGSAELEGEKKQPNTFNADQAGSSAITSTELRGKLSFPMEPPTSASNKISMPTSSDSRDADARPVLTEIGSTENNIKSSPLVGLTSARTTPTSSQGRLSLAAALSAVADLSHQRSFSMELKSPRSAPSTPSSSEATKQVPSAVSSGSTEKVNLKVETSILSNSSETGVQKSNSVELGSSRANSLQRSLSVEPGTSPRNKASTPTSRLSIAAAKLALMEMSNQTSFSVVEMTSPKSQPRNPTSSQEKRIISAAKALSIDATLDTHYNDYFAAALQDKLSIRSPSAITVAKSVNSPR